jgi:hypothetical protein
MASTTVPEIAYRFLAQNAEALKANKQVKDSIKEIDLLDLFNIDLSVKGLTKSVKGLLPTLSAAAFGTFAYSALQAADAVGDAAERAQLAVGEFGRLEYIASSTGVNFNELTGAIKDYRKGLDEASLGQGNVKEGLDRLYLSAAELRGISLEDQLALIADRFKAISDPAERAAVAQKIFGGAGQALIPLLAKGGEGLKELGEEAERLGQVFDERAVAGADRLTGALGRLTQASKVAAGNFFGNLAADILGTGNAIKDAEHKLAELIARRDELQANPLIFGQAASGELLLLNQEIKKLENNLIALQIAANPYGSGADLPFAKWRKEMIDDSIQPITITAQKIKEESEYDKLAKKWIEERRQLEADAAVEKINQQADLDRETQRMFAENQRGITGDLESELKRRHELEDARRAETRGREQELQQVLTDFRRQGANAAVTLLTAYGGKYKKFAQGILAIEKAHAIAKTIISTKAAAAAALEYYGPTPWGYAAAAAAIAYGVAQVAAIASTFIGGGSSAAGSPHNPIIVEPGSTTPENETLGTANPQGQQRVVQIVIQGNVYSGRETADFLIQQISQRINEYDAVIIQPTSRQARELQPEPIT